MTKKQISVPVGADVEVMTYAGSCGQYLRYTNKITVDVAYSSINDVIKKLQRIKRNYGKYYTYMCFDAVHDCGCYHDCSCSETFYVQGMRLENDVEYEFRLADEKQRTDEQTKRDQVEYKRLRAIFNEKEKK